MAQSSVVDSLNTQLDYEKDDSLKVLILLDLSRLNVTPKESVLYAQKALVLAEASDNPKLVISSRLALSQAFIKQRQYEKSKNVLLTTEKIIPDEISYGEYKFKCLMALGEYYRELNDLDSSKYYIEKAKVLAIDMGNDAGRSLANYRLGLLAYIQSELSVSLERILESKEFYELNMIDVPWEVYNSLGNLYKDMANYPMSLQFYLDALDAPSNKDNQTNLFVTFNNLANLYKDLGKTEKSIDYYEQALKISVVDHDINQNYYFLKNKGVMSLDMGDTLNGLNYLNTAYQTSHLVYDICDIVDLLNILGGVMLDKQEYDSAMLYYKLGVSKSEECQNSRLIALTRKGIGCVHKELGNYAESESYFIDARNKMDSLGFSTEKANALYELYDLYKLLGEHELALAHYEKYVSVRDSMFNKDTEFAIFKASSQYDFKKEIQYLEHSKRAQRIRLEAELTKQEVNRNVLLLILVLMLLLALSIVRSYLLVRRQNDRLEKLNEEKNTLLGVVGHDLRSPLNNIKSLLSLMKSDPSLNNSSSGANEYLSLVLDSTDFMRDMIDKTLDISAIENMKVNLNLQKSDIGKIIKRVSDSFDFMAGKKSIALHNHIDSGKFYALVDKGYIIQVFDNLISNALKYSDSGSEVNIEASKVGQKLVIHVRDQGQGMSEADMKKIFTKYQRLSSKPTADEESIGLGLYIAKKLINAMNGTIECESKLDAGSTFTITLPTY